MSFQDEVPSTPRPPLDGRAARHRAASGVLLALLSVPVILISRLTYGLSSMCTDDFDSSDCGGARAASMLPLLFLIGGAVLWIVGVCRKDELPLWVWSGVALAALPLAFVGAM
jgi:hypothetical protein